MREEHVDPEGGQLALQPVPVQRRLEDDGQRLPERGEPGRERIERRVESAVWQHDAVRAERTGGDVALMEIESTVTMRPPSETEEPRVAITRRARLS